MDTEHMESLTEITAATQALAGLIQQNPRWVAWQEAQVALEQDTELVAPFDRYRELSQKAQQARQNGNGLSGPEMLELAEVQEKIQNHERYQQREQAATGMTELLREVNLLVSNELGLNFAATAAPRSGCCG